MRMLPNVVLKVKAHCAALFAHVQRKKAHPYQTSFYCTLNIMQSSALICTIFLKKTLILDKIYKMKPLFQIALRDKYRGDDKYVMFQSICFEFLRWGGGPFPHFFCMILLIRVKLGYPRISTS